MTLKIPYGQAFEPGNIFIDQRNNNTLAVTLRYREYFVGQYLDLPGSQLDDFIRWRIVNVVDDKVFLVPG